MLDLKNNKSWLISAAMAIIVALWLASGLLREDKATDSVSAVGEQSRDDSVRVRTQTAETVQRIIAVNGKTEPARTARLAAETDGRVVFTGAMRGSNVETGEVIVRLDKRDREARLAEAEATVLQRNSELASREKLKSESYVSESQLLEAAVALEAARAELMRAQLDIERRTVRAPFGGALQERLVEIGDFVAVGDPIATFVDNRSIVISASLSEFDAGYVKAGDLGSAELATGETVSGRIRYVAPVANESTRTFGVEMVVDNADGQLRAGGTAVLKIPAEDVLAHHIAPSLLSIDVAGNVGVKIINSLGAVEFVETDIALATDDGIWIAGLPTTATIITVGQGYVVDGAIVETIDESVINSAANSDSSSESR